MKITYRKTSPEALLLQRYLEDGKGSEYVLTASEDAAIYAIQSAGRPCLMKTGITFNSADKEGTVLFASLMPSITDGTGLILVNPLIQVGEGTGEVVLRLINLARNVQTIQRGSMLATLSVLNSASAEFVEATAQTRRSRKPKSNNERK